MHICPDCGARCYCDGKKGLDPREASCCVHCCTTQESDKAKMEEYPASREKNGEGHERGVNR
jgi:hypothetical protein